MRRRLKTNRRALHDQLVNVLKVCTLVQNARSKCVSNFMQTPGHWTHLLNERGLFS